MRPSQFAANVRCAYCYKTSPAGNWPANGDRVPFYAQTAERTEDSPGAYRLAVSCPHCQKEWFVVWNENPT